MKKSKDPTDFREQWSKDELRKRQQRRKSAQNQEKARFLRLAINTIIGASIAWVLWLTYKFLIEKGIL